LEEPEIQFVIHVTVAQGDDAMYRARASAIRVQRRRYSPTQVKLEAEGFFTADAAMDYGRTSAARLLKERSPHATIRFSGDGGKDSTGSD
jgi:hypothetical protein